MCYFRSRWHSYSKRCCSFTQQLDRLTDRTCLFSFFVGVCSGWVGFETALIIHRPVLLWSGCAWGSLGSSICVLWKCMNAHHVFRGSIPEIPKCLQNFPLKGTDCCREKKKHLNKWFKKRNWATSGTEAETQSALLLSLIALNCGSILTLHSSKLCI